MPVAYISGPMRGYPDQNRAAFTNASKRWSGFGYRVINPAEEDVKQGIAEPGSAPLDDYIRRDVDFILKLDPARDIVVAMEGWQSSKGARAEIALAEWRKVYIVDDATYTAKVSNIDTTRGLQTPLTPFGKTLAEEQSARIRTFSSGATRDTDAGKLKYEGFFSPEVLKRRAEYMHKHRTQSDGSLREPDNWQKGMPRAAFMDSLVRHTVDLWREWRGVPKGIATALMEELLCAIMFNAEGLMHEILLGRDVGADTAKAVRCE